MKTLVFASILFGCSIAFGSIETGIAAYHRGDFESARKEFAQAAEREDPAGLHMLASLYYQGHGVAKDPAHAFALFMAAAEKGYRPSQVNIGLMYQKGEGVARDMGKAVHFLTAAGEQGDLQATFTLGTIFRTGDGVEVDHRRAAGYYRFAAERGHIGATNELGLLHAQGQGVRLDYVEAYGWMALAASAGDEKAKMNLAQLTQILDGKVSAGEARATEIRSMIEERKRAGGGQHPDAPRQPVSRERPRND